MKNNNKKEFEKMLKKDIPKYKITIDELYSDGEDLGISKIAYTAKPAVLTKGMAFNENVRKLKFSDDSKLRIVAPAMIPMEIYRFDNNEEYYVEFTVEEIELLHKKFMMNLDNSKMNFNIEHDNDRLVESFILESWIVESKEDKSKSVYGIDVPVGTVMMVTQFKDKKDFEYMIENDITGYSIEGFLGMKLSEIPKIEECKCSVDEDPNEFVLTNDQKSKILEFARTVDGTPRQSGKYYKYEATRPGHIAQRNFCKELMFMDKWYSRKDIDDMSRAGMNSEFAQQGSGSYSIFKYRGGSYCKHSWVSYEVVVEYGGGYKVLEDTRKEESDRPVPRLNFNNDKNKQEKMEEKQLLPAGEYVMGDKIYIVKEDGTFEIKDKVEASEEVKKEEVKEEVKKEELSTETEKKDEVKEEELSEDKPEEEVKEEVKMEEVPTYTKEEVDTKINEVIQMVADLKAELSTKEDNDDIVEDTEVSLEQRFSAFVEFARKG